MAQTRRTFLKFLVFAINFVTSMLLAIPVAGYLVGPLFRKRENRWIEAGSVESFQGPDPKPARIKYVSDEGFKETKETVDAYIVTKGSEVTVFSSKCTHLGCNISWKVKEAEGQFFCPCHGGRFDRDGNVLGGPPPAPLTRLPAKIEGGKIYVQV